MSDELGSRISILFLGVLGHFFREVTVPLPLGCDLGDRTIDMHLDILHRFGFAIKIENNICVMTRSVEQIHGCSIHLSYPSVGATETAIMLSVLAQGKSCIRGIAIEPEINSLILFLQKCGARIKYTGDRELLIEGVSSLNSCTFRIIGDRLEAASWACMACATDGDIVVHNIDPQNLINFFGPYSSLGGGFEVLNDDSIRFYRKSKELSPIFLETGPYPMFSTDYQPMIATLMMQANGSSIIHETLFTKRLDYLKNLKSFGLDYTLDDLCYGRECRFAGKNHVHSAILNGKVEIVVPGTERIWVDTIRSGFAYIIAATRARKEVSLDNIQLVERGFEHIVEKLRSVGIETEEFN